MSIKSVIEPPKKLDPQTFIFLAASDVKFRTKYFNNINAIVKDYVVTKKDFNLIKKIDFNTLKKNLADIDAGIRSKVVGMKSAGHNDTCHSSHNKSNLGTHTSGTHNNTCGIALNKYLKNKLTVITKPENK